MSAFALSIVIPVYNGASSIRELVAALEALAVPGGHEIILVNDGSEDESLAACRGLLATTGAPITLINLARNFGEHNAVMAGLGRAGSAHDITMDDDLQNPPLEVVRLLEHAQRTGKDVVYTYYAAKAHPSWRNVASRFANWSADRLLDIPKGPYLSSFRCMNAFVVEQLLRYTGPFPYVNGLILQCTRSIDQLPTSVASVAAQAAASDGNESGRVEGVEEEAVPATEHAQDAGWRNIASRSRRRPAATGAAAREPLPAQHTEHTAATRVARNCPHWNDRDRGSWLAESIIRPRV
jgi:hypothetical protein